MQTAVMKAAGETVSMASAINPVCAAVSIRRADHLATFGATHAESQAALIWLARLPATAGPTTEGLKPC